MDQVTEHLWITDIQGVQQQSTSRFDAVITVCQDNVEDNVGVEHYHHYPLSDGPPIEDSWNPGVFDYEVFADAVDTLIEHATNNRVTLIHCHAGQSRSVMTLATALTQLTDETYDQAVETIKDARSRDISPDGAVEDFARRYVEEHSHE